MNHIKIEDNKNNIIKKHEILVKNARYKLSELGIKTISLLISMVNSKDDDFKEYTLKIDDFKELIGSNSQRTYEYVDALTNELMSKPFKIGDKKFLTQLSLIILSSEQIRIILQGNNHQHQGNSHLFHDKRINSKMFK